MKPSRVFWYGFVVAASVPGLIYMAARYMRYLYRCVDDAVRLGEF